MGINENDKMKEGPKMFDQSKYQTQEMYNLYDEIALLVYNENGTFQGVVEDGEFIRCYSEEKAIRVLQKHGYIF